MSLRERLTHLNSMRLWLTPGMGVKRHVLVAGVGMVILIGGAIAGLLWLFSGNRQVLSAPIEAVLVSDSWDRLGSWLSLLVILAGLATTVLAIQRLNRSLLSNWTSHPEDAAVVLHRRLLLARGPRIVAFGGGTGLSNLLRGLRNHTSNLTGVVTVSDDGGSSGRLRAAFDIPAPGDLTDCLAALSGNEQELGRLLEYRFHRGGELEGHTFGNLLITTLAEVEGDFGQALRALNTLLNLQGAVYPATSEPISLVVQKESAAWVAGESQARSAPGPIRSVGLRPEAPESLPEVIQATHEADLVVLGPGSLFTSTLPPLLIPRIRSMLHRVNVPIVYVTNIMTEAGETDGFNSFDHVEALHAHLGRYPDQVLVNTAIVDELRQEAYRSEGADVVRHDPEPFSKVGIRTVELDLLGAGTYAQHDSNRLAEKLIELSQEGCLHPSGTA